MTYSSSCHHHLHHPLFQYTPANPGSPGKWPLKRRERQDQGEQQNKQIKQKKNTLNLLELCFVEVISSPHTGVIRSLTSHITAVKTECKTPVYDKHG